MKLIVAVSGTPGTGKTWLSRRIARKFGMKYINVNLLIRRHKLYQKYDRKRKCYVVDEKKLSKFIVSHLSEKKSPDPYLIVDKNRLIKDIKKCVRLLEERKLSLRGKRMKKNLGYIIDSHLSHFLPKSFVDFCIITKTDLGRLKKRLRKRKYSKKKVFENLQAEIFDTCYEEARKIGHKIIVYHN